MAPKTIRLSNQEGDCCDREHVSLAAADSGEDSASGSCLSIPYRVLAVVWQTGVGAIESVRPCRAAELVQHGAERDDRRRYGDGRRGGRLLAAGGELSADSDAVPSTQADQHR